MMKSFLIKKALERQMKNMPEEQREKVEKLATENPELLMQIAQEVQEEMQNGKDQMTAFQEVAKCHQDALKDALS